MGEEDSDVRTKPSWYESLKEQVPAGGSRNLHSVWTIPTASYAGAHFAVFPSAIPERCIRLGTSDRGACPECGAPWKRVTGNGEPNEAWRRASGGDANGEYHGEALKDYEGTGAQNASEVKRRVLAGMVEKVTVGWVPTCSCGREDTIPCAVLDPFAGSGTTLAVAKRLGRRSVGIELNPLYLDLIRQRLAETRTETAHHPGQRRITEGTWA